MERIANKARSFEEAEEWDRKQYQEMTPNERMEAAADIKKRVFPGYCPDIRECKEHRKFVR